LRVWKKEQSENRTFRFASWPFRLERNGALAPQGRATGMWWAKRPWKDFFSILLVIKLPRILLFFCKEPLINPDYVIPAKETVWKLANEHV